MIDEIRDGDSIIAIIIRNYENMGITFFTPKEFLQQLSYISHPAGHIIPAHIHNKVFREVFYTQEVLFIRSGRVKLDLYNEKQCYIQSIILEKGDVIRDL